MDNVILNNSPVLTALDYTFYLITTCLLSSMITKRFPYWKAIFEMSVARIFVVLLLIDSWMFLAASGILLLGIGTNSNAIACQTAIIWCIALYGTTKVLIYLFLMERVFLVHLSSVTRRSSIRSRLSSIWYRIACFFMLLWIGVLVAMVVGQTSYIRESDGVCVVGLKVFATVPMIVVDSIVNIYLTVAFMIPVLRSNFSKAQGLAHKSAIAAIIALITSFVNIYLVTRMKGEELSFVCLGSCGIDVMINSSIIFWITSGDSVKNDSPTTNSKSFSNVNLNRKFVSSVQVDINTIQLEEVAFENDGFEVRCTKPSTLFTSPNKTRKNDETERGGIEVILEVNEDNLINEDKKEKQEFSIVHFE